MKLHDFECMACTSNASEIVQMEDGEYIVICESCYAQAQHEGVLLVDRRTLAYSDEIGWFDMPEGFTAEWVRERGVSRRELVTALKRLDPDCGVEIPEPETPTWWHRNSDGEWVMSVISSPGIDIEDEGEGGIRWCRVFATTETRDERAQALYQAALAAGKGGEA